LIAAPSATPSATPSASPWCLCVAPMLDWTDRHCRYLHRLLSRRARLYTEMLTTGALLHGDAARHLRFDPAERALALQLGGSEASALARCARLGAQWGYDEINLNCGCPSPRVQRGAFGACLMREAALVADCVKAMQDAVSIPVTVKHRIGLDGEESYGFVRDFVGTLFDAGCRVFIVHARSAWLRGLSPKQNREVPPLRHGVAVQIKRDFAQATIVVNGGIQDDASVQALLAQGLDGVMAGRAAYHNPWWLAGWDSLHARIHACAMPADKAACTRETIEAHMLAYMQRQAREHGTHWQAIARHMLGLRNGLPGARRWRQVWSGHRYRHLPPQHVMHLARGEHGTPIA